MFGIKQSKILAGVVCLVVVGALGLTAVRAGEKVESGLTSLVPDSAYVIVERRGHTKVKAALDASSTGKLYNDEAVREFLDATREAIGEKMLEDIFDLDDEDEIITLREHLHKVLLPVWYDRSILFFVPPAENKENSDPDMGIIIVPGAKYRKDFLDSLKVLMEKSDEVKSFTYISGSVTWTGVAGYAEELPEDPAELKALLEKTDLFMITQRHPMVYAATSIHAADQISKKMSAPDKKNANPGLLKAYEKTAMKDWAMRWFVDLDAIAKMTKDKDSGETFLQEKHMKVLGLETLRSVGGYIGYMDNAFANQIYIDTPGVKVGLMRSLKIGGDFKAGLALMPSQSNLMFAGQLEPKAIAKIVTGIFKLEDSGESDEVEVIEAEEEMAGAEEVAVEEDETKPAAPKAESEKVQKFTKLFNELAASLGPNGGGYVTDIQTAMMGGGAPVGMVFEVKDPARAAKAMQALCEFGGMEELVAADDSDEESTADSATTKPAATTKPSAVAANTYRKVVIHQMDDDLFYAVMKDRMIIAFSDGALKAGIDAAKDNMSGFAPDSKAAKLGKKLPKGPGVFVMDLPALTKLVWPMLVQATQNGGRGGPGEFLRSVPSTQKIVSLIGPEMIVFIPDEGGMLLSSRGAVPLGSMLPVGYGGAVYFVMMIMH
ncbi:MAG: hypothetical protein KAR11_08750 [Phycisphaerae bacterium]|nr:hypothetical protein [Phycisphaerae bacterium]